jgi:hypothetical protein
MRSSEARQRAYARAFATAACAMLGACAGAQGTAAKTGATSPVACAGPADAPAGVRARAAALQGAVEAGPLYIAATRGSAVSTCSVRHDAGAIELTYTLRDGGALRSSQDPRIEYYEQQVRFASPPAESPVEILQRAELAAYGAKGCGIEWRKPHERTRQGESTVEVFRGNVCNCQGRVSRDERGRVTTLALRSAC